jgi:hypothetical protein
VVEIIIDAQQEPHCDIEGKTVPVGGDVGVHKGIGPVQQEKDIQQVEYFSKLQEFDYIFIQGKDQEKEAQGIGDPAESPVSYVKVLAAGKHVKIHEGH